MSPMENCSQGSPSADDLDSHLPPWESINKAVEIYFSHCQYQPLWILDEEAARTPEYWCEETLLPMLACAVCCAPDSTFPSSVQSANVYTDSARSVLMSKIANGNVTMRTLQGLCILSYFNYASKHDCITQGL